jgi:hypothetical protein
LTDNQHYNYWSVFPVWVRAKLNWLSAWPVNTSAVMIIFYNYLTSPLSFHSLREAVAQLTKRLDGGGEGSMWLRHVVPFLSYNTLHYVWTRPVALDARNLAKVRHPFCVKSAVIWMRRILSTSITVVCNRPFLIKKPSIEVWLAFLPC